MATTANVNLMAGVKFTLLGTELTAGFEKTDTGQHIFVYQDLDKPNDGITIDKVISDIKTLMGRSSTDNVPGLSTKEISDKLTLVSKQGSAIDPTAIRLVLHTVYLDIMKPTTGESTVEYAFRVDVIATGLIPAEISLINIDSITLAIWNTTKEKVKKQLAISTDSAE